MSPKKNFGSEKKFWSKNFGSENKFCIQNFYCCSCSSRDMGPLDPFPPKISQTPMSSLCVKFQTSSTPRSNRFWWGLLLLWQGGKTKSTPSPRTEVSTLDFGLEFDNKQKSKIKKLKFDTETPVLFIIRRVLLKEKLQFWTYIQIGATLPTKSQLWTKISLDNCVSDYPTYLIN